MCLLSLSLIRYDEALVADCVHSSTVMHCSIIQFRAGNDLTCHFQACSPCCLVASDLWYHRLPTGAAEGSLCCCRSTRRRQMGLTRETAMGATTCRCS